MSFIVFWAEYKVLKKLLSNTPGVKLITGVAAAAIFAASTVIEDDTSGDKKERTVNDEGTLENFEVYFDDNDNDINYPNNTIVSDGDGGLKVQLNNGNRAMSKKDFGIQAILNHENQHIVDVYSKATNLEVIQNHDKAGSILRFRQSKKNKRIFERRGYRAAIIYLKTQLNSTKSRRTKNKIQKPLDQILRSYDDFKD